MNKPRLRGQTLIELLIVLLPIVLSIVFSRIFFRYIGWWGLLPGVTLGIGVFATPLYILVKFFSPPAIRTSRNPRA